MLLPYYICVTLPLPILGHMCSECDVSGVTGEPPECKNKVECKDGNQMCFAKWKCVGEEGNE